ncbi:hypothetical protein T08_350 [Trichinella sp. T8]|nr:hypothetical protein T08_350 [Trichinella sp. T8]
MSNIQQNGADLLLLVVVAANRRKSVGLRRTNPPLQRCQQIDLQIPLEEHELYWWSTIHKFALAPTSGRHWLHGSNWANFYSDLTQHYPKRTLFSLAAIRRLHIAQLKTTDLETTTNTQLDRLKSTTGGGRFANGVFKLRIVFSHLRRQLSISTTTFH